jgi:hypothetical protein
MSAPQASSVSELVERLLRTEKRKSYAVTNRTAPPIESEYDAPVNPDGPEAADHLQSLTAERDALREALVAARKVVLEDAEACRAFAHPDESSEPERVLGIIDAALKDASGEVG